MERLTARYNGHAIMAWEHENKYTTEEWIDMLTTRLAAYEDTGLEPEEIAEVRFLIAAERDPQKLARLRKLVEADQQGRLVVLPCKVGDWVYALLEVPTAAKDDIGKTVFLTREEAERALEGGEGRG